MNLTDNDILELNELCNALVEETISETQKSRLLHWLSTSAEAREFYVRAVGLSASLFSYASEMQTEELAVPAPAGNLIVLWRWAVGALAAAAAIVLLFWFNPLPKRGHIPTAAQPSECIAQLTGSKDCQWANSTSSVPSGGRLHKGQRVELAKGFAEITFDSGAQVVLEGPASFDARSAWEAGLNHGTLKANVPLQAIGFRISNPAVEVVDLGTEFSMSADAGGAAEVLVLKGEVEAKSTATADRTAISLKGGESRRFATSGVSEIDNSDLKFARFSQSIALDHFNPPTDWVHWSFDETEGDVLTAETYGQLVNRSVAWLKNISKSSLPTVHVKKGYRQGALRFDGHMYVRGAFPGISGSSAHTVVFWVKIPKDAKLSNAYAMVAWSINSDTLGSHPIHISWNRNPNEGTIGALRTDYGGGYALGSTPLRDGQWHHIAVIFIPSEDLDQTVSVKQYVDGRLEGEGMASPPGSDIFFKKPDEKKAQAMKDGVWLGCRLGINEVRTERFYGEMDELFIVDRPLVPREVVQLMNHNQLHLEMAGVK